MIRVESNPLGPRVYVLGQRVHHGAIGVLLVLTGLAMALDDKHDYRDWFRRSMSAAVPLATEHLD